MDESNSNEREIERGQNSLQIVIQTITSLVLYSIVYFFKHIIIKIAPDIVSQNDVYSVCHIFFKKMKVEYSRYNSALFIDSKINQLLVTV